MEKLAMIGNRMIAVLIALLALAAAAQAAAPDSFVSKVTASPVRVAHGGSTALSVSITDKSTPVPTGITDIEVFDAKGKRVAQKFWQAQRFAKGKTAAYVWKFKPATPGVYTVKLGVFGASWKPLYHWQDKALTVTAL